MMGFPAIAAIICAVVIIIFMVFTIDARTLVGLSISFLVALAITFAIGGGPLAEKLAILAFYLLASGLILYLLQYIEKRLDLRPQARLLISNLRLEKLPPLKSQVPAETVVGEIPIVEPPATKESETERDRIVLDASVVIEWLWGEEDTPQALKIGELLDGETMIFVPDLLLYDVARKLRNRTNFTQAKIYSAIEFVSSVGLQFVALTPALMETASKMMPKYRITLNQAIFVALASMLGADLITADKGLYKRTKQTGFVTLVESQGES